MLKIIEIIPILSVRRGAEVFFANLCMALNNRKDIRLDVVLLYDKIDKSFLNQFDDMHIKPYFCHKRKGIDLRASKILKKILCELKPDIIHTHNCCFFTYYLAFKSKKVPWKYFHTCHSVPDVEATRIEHFFRKRFSKKGRLFNIGISPIVSNSFKEKYGVSYVPYVLNGIPLSNETFSNEKLYDFIMCASFDENKNHKLLINAFEQLSNYQKRKLICLGDGPLFDEIKNEVEQKGLKDNILLLGSVSNVGDYLDKSRIFVLPSLNEGIPISIIEAMNYGLPIIASDVGGIPDIVNEQNGILFPSNDSKQLTEAMSTLLNNPILCNKISEYNKKYSQKFSIDNTAEAYLQIFKREL